MAGFVLLSALVGLEGREAIAQPVAPAPYPVDGTWMYDRPPQELDEQLARFRAIGGRFILKFGPQLRITEGGANEVHAALSALGCTDCVAEAERAASSRRVTIDAWAWHGARAPEQARRRRHLGPAMVCRTGDATLDATFERAGRTFTRLILPSQRGTEGCELPVGGRALVVFMWHDAGLQDPDAELLSRAAEHEIGVYLAAPGIPTQWNAARNILELDDRIYVASTEFNRRYFSSMRRLYAEHRPQMLGVYQTMEVDLAAHFVEGASAPLADAYRTDAASFHAAFPDLRYVISPYVNTLRSRGGSTTTEIVRGFTELAELGVDVIAPQDGRGTGKVGLYDAWQAPVPLEDVDPLRARYADAAPDMASRDIWFASTREVFDALYRAHESLRAHGNETDLWINLEAFEDPNDPDDELACGSRADRYKTTKRRLDRALAQAGDDHREGRSRTRVAYMWDPFFVAQCTDAGPNTTSLYEEIIADHDRPLLTRADDVGDTLRLVGHALHPRDVGFVLSIYHAGSGLRPAVPGIVSRTRWSPTRDLVELSLPPEVRDALWYTVRAIKSDGRMSDPIRLVRAVPAARASAH